MLFFELLQLLGIFLDYLWVVYLWHKHIMPSLNRNGITLQNPSGEPLVALLKYALALAEADPVSTARLN
jgi:hypothetical protein